MKVLVLGASGIVGQHLRRWEPGLGVEVTYTSRQALPWDNTVKVNLTSDEDVEKLLKKHDPDVIINLAGENRPDVVEKDPDTYWFINVEMPLALKRWCEQRNRWLIHISTQGVFEGNVPPYRATRVRLGMHPVNEYGMQKLRAEQLLMERSHETQIILVRLTFMLGVRPFKELGRMNPLEQIFDSVCQLLQASQADADAREDAEDHIRLKQVDDRYFSPCFANSAAAFLWQLVGSLVSRLDPILDRYLERKRVFNIGLPMKLSRAVVTVAAGMQLAHQMKVSTEDVPLVEPVLHDDAFPYPQYARRPKDTTFAPDAVHDESWEDAIKTTVAEWRVRMERSSEHDRALELALFFGIREGEARVQLMRGFIALHHDVAKDFRAAKSMKPQSWTDFDLLQWYKQTHAYCWELTAYHLDAGYNYEGMCNGISEHIVREYGEGATVVALGDGVGDLTMNMLEHKLDPVYHDLMGSQTARFAAFRFTRHSKTPLMWLTDDWAPPQIAGAEMLKDKIKAVVALDFFEHVTDVEAYVQACWDMLVPGGVLMAVNAFGIGDAEHGDSIPMHLSRNNVYADPDPNTGEAGWDVLCRKIGFIDLKNGWRQKPA